MLVPYSWLKDFVNLKKPANDIADMLSLSTIGVDEVKEENGERLNILKIKTIQISLF